MADVLVLMYYDDVFIVCYGPHLVGQEMGRWHRPFLQGHCLAPRACWSRGPTSNLLGRSLTSPSSSFVAIKGLVTPHKHIGSSSPFPFVARSAGFDTMGTCIGKFKRVGVFISLSPQLGHTWSGASVAAVHPTDTCSFASDGNNPVFAALSPTFFVLGPTRLDLLRLL